MASMLANGRSASRPSVQRYTEIPARSLEDSNRDLGLIWMSEGNRFFRPASSERQLWATGEDIESASAVTAHKDGILQVAPGESRTVLDREYRRVVVSNRGTGLAGGAGAAGRSASAAGSANEPFEKILLMLAAHGGSTLGHLITQTKETPNPFTYGAYPYYAFEAIRTQFGLEVGKQIENAPDGKAHKADAKELKSYLEAWRDRIAVVNSETAHKFQFLVTECGGFSRLVAAGAEGTQADVEAGGRMKMDVDEDIPGPWRNHYAAVLMTDGPDRVTLESAAGMDKWWFGMYGSRNLGQTFVVKTLLAKLDIGTARSEAGSRDAADYVRARLAGDDPAAGISAAKLKPGLQTHLDGLLREAGTTSVPSPRAVAPVRPGKQLADQAAVQLDKLRSLRRRISSRLLLPALTKEQEGVLAEFADKAEDRVRTEFGLLADASSSGEVDALVRKISAERPALVRDVTAVATTFVLTELKNLQADQARWRVQQSKAAQATFQSRIDLTRQFGNTLADLSWLPSPVPATTAPAGGTGAGEGS